MKQKRAISELWFVTEWSLKELASKIGLEKSYYDFENYWEWVDGCIGGNGFNISRTHTLLPHESHTRIGIRGVSRTRLNTLIERLQGIGIAPIYVVVRHMVQKNRPVNPLSRGEFWPLLPS